MVNYGIIQGIANLPRSLLFLLNPPDLAERSCSRGPLFNNIILLDLETYLICGSSCLTEQNSPKYPDSPILVAFHKTLKIMQNP